jgi:hypothetical protein
MKMMEKAGNVHSYKIYQLLVESPRFKGQYVVNENNRKNLLFIAIIGAQLFPFQHLFLTADFIIW